MKTISIIVLIFLFITSLGTFILNLKAYRKDKEYISRKFKATNFKINKGGHVSNKERKDLETEAALISIKNIINWIGFVTIFLSEILLIYYIK